MRKLVSGAKLEQIKHLMNFNFLALMRLIKVLPMQLTIRKKERENRVAELWLLSILKSQVNL